MSSNQQQVVIVDCSHCGKKIINRLGEWRHLRTNSKYCYVHPVNEVYEESDYPKTLIGKLAVPFAVFMSMTLVVVDASDYVDWLVNSCMC